MNELAHHKEVTTWMKRVYPKVIFRTDYSAGLKLTRGQASTHYKLQHGKGYPDLFIALPVGEYAGLYIELKALDTGLILKDGTLTTDKHVRKQYGVLVKLHEAGYASTFAEGHTEAKEIIRAYMNAEKIYPYKYKMRPVVDKPKNNDDIF